MKKFVVLGTQRTGSSAISKLINLHPHILCGLEWTTRTAPFKKIKTAKHLLSGNLDSLRGFDRDYIQKKNLQNINWVGFKILFSSSDKWIAHPKYSVVLWIDQLREHINWLKTCRDIHIIHIIRNDNMDWLKSVFMAKTTGKFSGKTYPAGYKVHINIRNAISRIQSKNWINYRIKSLQSTNPYHQIQYEDFNDDNRKTAVDITRFLNCDPGLVNFTKYNAVKQSKGPSKKYIRNYSDLYRVLKREDFL